MITKKVTRHYCEFCRKGRFDKPGMIAHEASCTRNPSRFCYLCETKMDFNSVVSEFKKRDDVDELEDHNGDRVDEKYITKSEAAMQWLREECVGCPACVLSVLRQANVFAFEVFDYKKEKEVWYKEKTDELRQACQPANY